MIYGRKREGRIKREIMYLALTLSHKHTSLYVGNYFAVLHNKLGGA